MKHPLFLGSILLLAPAVAQAQFKPTPEFAPAPPTLVLPKSSSQTPALDSFAGVATKLQLQARWVRIDAAKLPANLPAWNRDGAWSQIATPDELKTLELMNRTGNVSVTEQQLRALNNQSADLSYPPFTSFQFLPAPDSGPIDDMIIPRGDLRIITPIGPPYNMPNLAKPESRLPEMAPMPGAGGKFDPPFIKPAPNSVPQAAPELDELLGYKFQLRPTIVGDQIALDLRSTNSAENIASLGRANYGETVVFSLPNIVELLQSQQTGGLLYYRARRTFLLVTPRLAPQTKSDSR